MFGPEARLPKKKSELARTACENAAVTWRWCPHCGLKISATSVVSSRQAAHTRLADYGYQSGVWDLVFLFSFFPFGTWFGMSVRDLVQERRRRRGTTIANDNSDDNEDDSRKDNIDDNEDDNSERQ